MQGDEGSFERLTPPPRRPLRAYDRDACGEADKALQRAVRTLARVHFHQTEGQLTDLGEQARAGLRARVRTLLAILGDESAFDDDIAAGILTPREP